MTSPPYACLFCMYYTLDGFDADGFAQCPKCGQYTLKITLPSIWQDPADEASELLHEEVLRRFAPVLGLAPAALGEADYDSDHTFFDASPSTYLVSVWLNRMLTTQEVASMLDVSVDWVGKLAARGDFEGARRAKPTKDSYQTGRWLIPLTAVKDMFIDNTMPEEFHREQAGGGVEQLELLFDNLADLLRQINQHLGHSKIEGLAVPSVVLDEHIIANSRLAALQSLGLVNQHHQGVIVPQIKCGPRTYILEEESSGAMIMLQLPDRPVTPPMVQQIVEAVGLQDDLCEVYELADDQVVTHYAIEPEQELLFNLAEVVTAADLCNLFGAELLSEPPHPDSLEAEPAIFVGYNNRGGTTPLTPAFNDVLGLDSYIQSASGQHAINQLAAALFDEWDPIRQGWRPEQ